MILHVRVNARAPTRRRTSVCIHRAEREFPALTNGSHAVDVVDDDCVARAGSEVADQRHHGLEALNVSSDLDDAHCRVGSVDSPANRSLGRHTHGRDSLLAVETQLIAGRPSAAVPNLDRHASYIVTAFIAGAA